MFHLFTIEKSVSLLSHNLEETSVFDLPLFWNQRHYWKVNGLNRAINLTAKNTSTLHILERLLKILFMDFYYSQKEFPFFRIVGFLLIFVVVSLILTLIDHLDLNSQIVIWSNAWFVLAGQVDIRIFKQCYYPFVYFKCVFAMFLLI